MYTLITDADAFSKLTETAQILKQHQSSFFMNAAWYQNFIDTVISKDGDSCVFIYKNNGGDPDNFAMLPLTLKQGNQQGSLQSLTNYYSPVYGFTPSKPQASVLQACFKAIADLKRNWDTLELRPLAYEDVFFAKSLLNPLKTPSIPFFCFGNWYLPIEGRSFADYFASLSSQVKNTVSRKTKKFLNTPTAQIEILTQLSDVPTAIQAFERVYQSSWKQPEPYPEFMPGLIRIAAEQGCLRMGVASLDGVPIAAQLWIVADNAAYIFKLAYDEAYKSYSAGSVLTAKLMEQVIDVDKVEVVDYLCGDDSYKKDWMSHRRERWGLLVFNLANGRGIMRFCQEMPKYWLKTLINKLKN